ncbi:unnamed protein product [Sphenostylis stenocarpa]|uniref:Uncharacterized protein n=1 Tax=Sphenostylis stenocarpa TaxID=92480 RepID=A0AA86T077_9FABA|nr:unnamed protein product [Sphenostylis stenocarpa]
MCSNTCNSACGCGTGANVVSSIWSSGLKKHQKRPRVPKRGPGVAELEKILREQGRIDVTTDKGNSQEFSSFISHPSSSLKFHPLQPSGTQNSSLPSPFSSNLAANVPSAPIFDHFGPTTLPDITSMYGKCGSLERSGGSDLVSPEKELFPLNLNSSKSNLNMNEPIDGNQYDSASSPSRNLSSDWPYSAKIQHTNNQHPAPITPMTNQFHGTATVGPQNHPELPSNQNSYNHMDAKWGSSLELSNTRFNSDMTVPGRANFPPFVTHEVPSPPMHLFPGVISKGNVLPSHASEDKGDSCQHLESSEPNHRPFYNFLEVEDSEVTENMRGADRGGREAGRVGIDLNLKL